MKDSKIEWTNDTWNPLRGCTKVSEGCRNCYAMHVAARFSGPGQPYEGLATRSPARWTNKVRLIEEHLEDPIRWQRPRLIFVNSMSDLFHEDVPDEWICAVWNVMRKARHHTYQILTKRPARMADVVSRLRFTDDGDGHVYLADRSDAMQGYPLGPGVRGASGMPWVWLGTSVEDQATADERVPLLLQTPAAVRFLSVEPMLGPVDLTRLLRDEGNDVPGPPDPPHGLDALRGYRWVQQYGRRVPMHTPKAHLHWIICGGESGHGARPMHPAWARSMRDRCIETGVAFFFKQWGEFVPRSQWRGDVATGAPPWGTIEMDGSWFPQTTPWNGHDDDGHGRAVLYRVGKKSAGRHLDGRTWDQMPDLARGQEHAKEKPR